MTYRFIAEGPKCGKTRDIEFIKPEKPCAHCGDCPTDDIEISVTRVPLVDRPPPRSLSDAEWDDIDSQKQIETLRSLRPCGLRLVVNNDK